MNLITALVKARCRGHTEEVYAGTMSGLMRSRGPLMAAVRRHILRRGGDSHPGGWWGPGTKDPSGHLFGEVPPPPGMVALVE